MVDNITTGLVCEIKPAKTKERNLFVTEQVLATVKELKAEPYILAYISFSYDVLKHINTLDSSAKTQYLDGSKAPETLKKDGISGLDYLIYKLKDKPEWIESAKANNLTLNAWTVDKPEDIDWLLDHNFNYITTDEPELVFERIKNSNQQKEEH